MATVKTKLIYGKSTLKILKEEFHLVHVVVNQNRQAIVLGSQASKSSLFQEYSYCKLDSQWLNVALLSPGYETGIPSPCGIKS